MLFPTTLVGSYPQPDWLIDRKKLAGRFPPRVRARELWRVAEPYLAEAQDDATRLAIEAQEAAGLDIVTDGEIRRESYSNRFATALEGVDIDHPGSALDRSGHPNPVPRVVGRIRRKHPVEVEDLLFLKRHTSRKTKITVPGPFTMSQQARPAKARQYGLKALNRALDGVTGETAVHICFGYAAVIHERPSKYLPSEAAFGKLRSMVEAANILRAAHGG
jgi:5-methyltetrahydropteroyltriglutamate--homocysteine methyltransferase